MLFHFSRCKIAATLAHCKNAFPDWGYVFKAQLWRAHFLFISFERLDAAATVSLTR